MKKDAPSISSNSLLKKRPLSKTGFLNKGLNLGSSKAKVESIIEQEEKEDREMK